MRRFWIGLFVLSLLGALSVSAQGPQAQISTSELRVRENPSPSANVVGSFALNEVVTMQGREDQQGNGGVWIFVTNGNITGWVLVDYLTYQVDINSLPIVNASGGGSSAPAANTTSTEPNQTSETTTTQAPVSVEGGISAQVAADANVRQSPDASAARITGVNGGTTVALVGRNAASTWVRAVLPDGSAGWISSQLVRASSPISALPVTNAAGEVVSSGATTADTTTTSAISVAPPLPSAGVGGFAYGAHVNGFGGTELMPALGMTWVKKQVRYNQGDNPQSAAWIVNEGHGRGFRVLLGVVGSPAQLGAGGDAYLRDYAAFVGGLAALGADAIEVWNEPNLDREWPNGQVSGENYTRLLSVSYNAIKGANANTVVISGAPAPTGFFGGCAAAGCDDLIFLQQMRAAGAANYMDCVGAHYNEGIVGPTQSSGDPRSEYYTRYFTPMVNTYAGAMGKPVCFTELGYVTPDGYGGMPAGFEWGNQNTVAEQAQWLAQAISLGSQNRNVRMIIVWNFNFNTPANSPDPAGAYAMIRPDGTCPACDALRR